MTRMVFLTKTTKMVIITYKFLINCSQNYSNNENYTQNFNNLNQNYGSGNYRRNFNARNQNYGNAGNYGHNINDRDRNYNNNFGNYERYYDNRGQNFNNSYNNRHNVTYWNSFPIQHGIEIIDGELSDVNSNVNSKDKKKPDCSTNLHGIYQVKNHNFHDNVTMNQALLSNVCVKDITEPNCL